LQNNKDQKLLLKMALGSAIDDVEAPRLVANTKEEAKQEQDFKRIV
jgi:hypothetical protein